MAEFAAKNEDGRVPIRLLSTRIASALDQARVLLGASTNRRAPDRNRSTVCSMSCILILENRDLKNVFAHRVIEDRAVQTPYKLNLFGAGRPIFRRKAAGELGIQLSINRL